jgi:hypothetical protein
MKNNKIWTIYAWITIILAIGFIFLCGYWLVYPYKPLYIDKTTGVILNENRTVEGNGYLLVKAKYCKKVNIASEVTTTFIDGFVYTTMPNVSYLPKGCADTIFQVHVPKSLPSGEYYIRQVYRYQVNPIRKVEVVVSSEKFNVIH